MDNEFTPKNIEDLKIQVREDLQMVVNGFNNDLKMWEDRTKSFANFRWVYDDATGNKRLAIQTIDLPVVRNEVAEEDLDAARAVLEEAAK